MAHSTYETPVYAATAAMPVRSHIEMHTLMGLLGDVTGKSILDVACGYGYYSRALAQRGAARVLGIDLSESLIGVARELEERERLGIEYRVLDVFEAPVLGAFDIALAAWLLPYATTVDELEAMARRLHAQLAPGGMLAGIVPSDTPDLQGNYTQYGMTLTAPDPPGDADEYDITFHVEPPFAIRSRIWTLPTLERALAAGGFHDVRWVPAQCSPEGLAEFGREYWEPMLTRPNLVFFTARG
ncbi:class I SAM-dependent methyltransferase [Pendulispora brunnea]|uniref:Class I SAM-dependent methyltransferase n=1 Tax=Pendulispora brunnea TaxID=2905690 RepID=A0ABZ2KGA9_9BACT